jgi:hypothetical protein
MFIYIGLWQAVSLSRTFCTIYAHPDLPLVQGALEPCPSLTLPATVVTAHELAITASRGIARTPMCNDGWPGID